ncbi:MAG TPA: hypothetical protein PKY77_26165 [Phycisphaerae bacterium]|nr:hypothetical protein [Phycisphaerae bacterium]HRY67698.1 hypothetical protein [Phycisphaerae bacterium]HSA25149.1 hypothetical protein [Phycisphaerae bacterium]
MRAEDQIDSENPDPLLDAVAAAAYLGLVGVVKHPAQAVRALCRKRRIQSTKVAGKVMVRRSWLEQYINENARTVYGQDA